jgi:hypothetical protein
MSNRVKREVRKVRREPKTQGNNAIREAQRQLLLAKRRVEGLEKTVENWTRLRDEGMPWRQSTDHSQEPCHRV